MDKVLFLEGLRYVAAYSLSSAPVVPVYMELHINASYIGRRFILRGSYVSGLDGRCSIRVILISRGL